MCSYCNGWGHVHARSRSPHEKCVQLRTPHQEAHTLKLEVASLRKQVSNQGQLQQETESLKAERCELQSKLEGTRHEAHNLKLEVARLQSLEADLRSQLVDRDARLQSLGAIEAGLRSEVVDQDARLQSLVHRFRCLHSEHTLSPASVTAPQPLTVEVDTPFHGLAGSFLSRLGVRERKIHQVQLGSGDIAAAMWQWESPDGSFLNFEPHISAILECYAAQGIRRARLTSAGTTLDIDLKTLEQRVVGGSGRVRKIRRVEPGTLPEPTWTPQQGPAELVDASPDHIDYCKVSHIMFSTEPGSLSPRFRLEKVERVQNEFLWGSYQAQRRNTNRMRGPAGLGERLLFHGTRRTNPRRIALSSPGFMIEYSADGLYGKGLYFAERPCYSDKYSHYTSEKGTKLYHMLVCSVICGRSKHMGCDIDRSMNRCRLPPEEYDSVCAGPHCPRVQGNGPDASVMFVVYQPQQVYPEYVVTYRECTPTDSVANSSSGSG